MLSRPTAGGLQGPKSNVLSLIGNTQLVELKRVYQGPGRIFAKCEFLNPGGSIKDRTAKIIIERSYHQGVLKIGQPVVEATSGNMGAGLAVVCASTGNPFIAVMSEGCSAERSQMLRGLGAEVILVSQVDGAPGQVTGQDVKRAAMEAQRIALEKGAFYVDQFHNPGSILGHKTTTGPEIYQQTSGQISTFIAAVGSGGTFCGTSLYLKEQDSKIRCLAVEPKGCEILAGKPVTSSKHIIQGTGYSTIPPHWNAQIVDGFLAVTEDEVRSTTRALASREGLFVGFSSGANIAAAIAFLSNCPQPDREIVVTVLCDSGMKYGKDIS